MICKFPSGFLTLIVSCWDLRWFLKSQSCCDNLTKVPLNEGMTLYFTSDLSEKGPKTKVWKFEPLHAQKSFIGKFIGSRVFMYEKGPFTIFVDTFGGFLIPSYLSMSRLFIHWSLFPILDYEGPQRVTNFQMWIYVLICVSFSKKFTCNVHMIDRSIRHKNCTSLHRV